MHILLTDVLACPRCGPEFGLILLADDVRERRVLHGHLGCPNCREEYPIRSGVADLRLPGPSDTPDTRAAPEGGEELALRVAALLGVRTPGGRLLLVGAGAEIAQNLARLVPDVEVITVMQDPDEPTTESVGVSQVVAGPVLPIQTAKLHGAAILGMTDKAWIPAVSRVLAPGARLLVEPVAAPVAEVLPAAGMQLLLEEAGSVLAVRVGVAHPSKHP